MVCRVKCRHASITLSFWTVIPFVIFQLPTIIHELGHTIGLYHEHTRTDRDKYVEIKWENIENLVYYNDFAIQPEKHPIEDIVPYDYKSIMHYGTNVSMLSTIDFNTDEPHH